jgi:glycosyltransferase involved in cell wall biosynthesis
MSTTRAHDRAAPLRLLLVSSTRSNLTGADRDWISLANALVPEAVEIVWVGSEGCQDALRNELHPGITLVVLNPGIPWFTYMVLQNARQQRSTWLWIKILLDHARRLVGPFIALERALKGSRPDIVVTNTVTVTLGALYAAVHARPHFWFVKDYLDTSLKAPRALARWIERFSTTVVVPSHAVARTFEKRVAVVRDGSDVSGIRSSAASGPTRERLLVGLGLPPQRPVVAQVGGLVWWKGQHVTVAALGQLAGEPDRVAFSMLFLGRGAGNPYQRELERQLEDSVPDWRGWVRFVEFASDDFSYLAAADVVVHPSVLPDPFPNAVREAMILGKPVIASREGGIPEMIDDGRNGILVTPGDAVELGRAVLDLLRSPSRRELMGRNAREHALSHFDIRARKWQFLELFRAAAPRTS